MQNSRGAHRLYTHNNCQNSQFHGRPIRHKNRRLIQFPSQSLDYFNRKGNKMQRIATVASLAALLGISTAHSQPVSEVEFDLAPNPTFEQCLGPDAKAHVKVTRGKSNDRLQILLSGIHPNLDFDMFTVQRSSLDGSGQPVANFAGFGLAWYQSDLHSNERGVGRTEIRTILLDQIFGFDADIVPTQIANLDHTAPPIPTRVPPTNTFHVGFWFNNPQDAAACGFDPTKPTPFNGEHKAGPLAMISLPVAPANLGPLCTSPTGVSEDEAAKDLTGLTLVCNP
jgi:hypothetical protein